MHLKFLRSVVAAGFIAVSLLSAAGTAQAGNPILIRPIHLFIEPGGRTATLDLENLDAEAPIRVQVTAYNWDHGSGANIEELKRADDVVIFPALVTLPKGEFRSVRFSAPPATNVERTYRVLVEQLPEPQVPGNAGHHIEAGVTIRTRFSIPLYVLPAGAAPKPQIADLAVHGAKVTFALTNSGNAHFVPKKVALSGTNGAQKVIDSELEISAVLANGRVPYESHLLPADCKKIKDVTVTVTSASGGDPLTASLPVAEAQCLR
jgi:fimbrial chaperone protein